MLYDFRSFINPGYYAFGKGTLSRLGQLIDRRKENGKGWTAYLIDIYFKDKNIEAKLPIIAGDLIIWIDPVLEPKTSLVDEYAAQIKAHNPQLPSVVVGMGGGTAMDYGKAVRLMVTNSGASHEYQGLDKIKNPGIYCICIPTISGTGAEVSMTTVLSGPEKKLGIKCDYTMPDEIIFDPELLDTVPDAQRFYTGMDCFIHNVESLEGTWITTMGKAFAEKSNEMCEDVFMNDSLSRIEADEKLMVASILGGNSITYAQVGVCHALSYGLAHVLGIHHGVGNCIVFNQLEKYYPEGYKKFKEMQIKAGVEIPEGICANVTDEQLNVMAAKALANEHMWDNAFGKEWRNHINADIIKDLYRKM